MCVFVRFLVLRLGSDQFYYFSFARTGFPLVVATAASVEEQTVSLGTRILCFV